MVPSGVTVTSGASSPHFCSLPLAVYSAPWGWEREAEQRGRGTVANPPHGTAAPEAEVYPSAAVLK